MQSTSVQMNSELTTALPAPARLLVTGMSGFLGWHLAQIADPAWEWWGTYQNRVVRLPGVSTLPADLTDFVALQHLLQQVRPAAVLHLAAQSKPNRCQTEPAAAHAINVTASLNLAGLCADAGIPLVFTSTDLVFDGLNPPYREDDPVCPVNLYGEQKVLAEQGILERHPTATICRMPLMFGAAIAPSFLQDFLKTLRAGEELRLFTDEFRTPVSGRDAVRGLLLALEQRVQGRLHLGGQQRLSRYEFGCEMVKAFELSEVKLRPTRQAEVSMLARRSPDVSLDSSRAFALGYAPGLIGDELRAIALNEGTS